MVNYNRMEEVPRAYGPLEPIGDAPVGRRRERRRVPYSIRNLALGVVTMGVLGAGMGVYFRPDTGEAERPARGGPAEAASEPASGPGIEIMVAETDTGPMDAAPVEAVPIDVSGLIAAGPPLTSVPYVEPPAALAPVRAAPAPAARERPFAYARRTFERMLPSRDEAPAPRPRAAPAPTVREAPAIRPARVETAPVAPPRVEPPARPAPSPAPVIVARVDPPRAAPAPERPTPSFDCGSARAAAQRMVCEDPRLAALDRRLSAEFERAVAAGHDRNALHLEQDHWLARREAAAPDPVAVADAYQRRIRQLQSMQ